MDWCQLWTDSLFATHCVKAKAPTLGRSKKWLPTLCRRKKKFLNRLLAKKLKTNVDNALRTGNGALEEPRARPRRARRASGASPARPFRRTALQSAGVSQRAEPPENKGLRRKERSANTHADSIAHCSRHAREGRSRLFANAREPTAEDLRWARGSPRGERAHNCARARRSPQIVAATASPTFNLRATSQANLQST